MNVVMNINIMHACMLCKMDGLYCIMCVYIYICVVQFLYVAATS